jgi:hypothetical protein
MGHISRGVRLRSVLLSAALLCLCAGCSAPSRRAFYYWKAEGMPSAAETAFLDRLRVVRLYLRLFDLDAGGQPQAALVLKKDSMDALTESGRRQIVPVVYVVPEALRKLDGNALRALGERTAAETMARCRAAGIAPAEVQMDYDWTAGTRENYFRFLEGVRGGLAAAGGRIVLSATVRLHQVRDRESAGIPPVDRGLLMAYNLSVPADPAVRNSILDGKALEPYLSGLPKYPLVLDLALPCFSWIVHFEGKRVLGLIPYSSAARGFETGGDFRRDGENWLEAKVRTYVAGRSVEPGDRLRIDRVDPPLVLEAAKALAARLPRGPRYAAFFSLDMDTLDEFSGGSYEAFEGIYSALGAGAARGP